MGERDNGRAPPKVDSPIGFHCLKLSLSLSFSSSLSLSQALSFTLSHAFFPSFLRYLSLPQALSLFQFSVLLFASFVIYLCLFKPSLSFYLKLFRSLKSCCCRCHENTFRGKNKILKMLSSCESYEKHNCSAAICCSKVNCCCCSRVTCC